MQRCETFVVVNPAAGRGRTAGRLARFRELLSRALPQHDAVETSRPGHEVELTDAALADGYRTIVAVGGDGTWNLVADRVLRSARSDVAVALLPTGTGNDFGKSFGIVADRAEAIVAAVAARKTRRVDVGRVGERHFLNVFGAGFDIAVIDDSYRVPLLRGDLLYRFCALRQLFFFPGLPLTIEGDDGGPSERVEHLMLVIANGRYFGGSFDIAPEADQTDGRLNLVSIADAPPLERAKLFGLVSKGRHPGHARVRMRRAARFRVQGKAPLRYELDGEVVESANGELQVECRPSALELVVP